MRNATNAACKGVSFEIIDFLIFTFLKSTLHNASTKYYNLIYFVVFNVLFVRIK